MPTFLSQQALSRGGLQLFLHNDLGQLQDASSVRWTVYSESGEAVSGRSLLAVRASVGEYYAPWLPDVPGGSYRVDWEIGDSCCGSSGSRVVTQWLYVIDPSMYVSCGRVLEAKPGPDAFVGNQLLGPSDLPLFLRNSDGLLQDAYAVFWTVVDRNGRAVTPKSAASQSGMGQYFAGWQVSVGGGDYFISWEWQESQSAPLQSTLQPFTVIGSPGCGPVPISGLCESCIPAPSCAPAPSCIGPTFSVACPPAAVPESPCATVWRGCAPCAAPPSGVPSGGSSCPPIYCPPVEVPRTVHIPIGSLPPAGAFTTQPRYQIPPFIRKITFYITYARSIPGGRATFKLLWGNGVDETQETVLDSDVQNDAVLATQNLLLQGLDGPVPPDDSPVSFVIYVSVPGGATTVRLLAAEKGAPGNPGTLGVTLTGSTG